ncbi:WD40-repeat-containing domain protein [Gongronella butleri]|nr:WD40-repeat-containing domain protein [Gongronella butleri]
MQAPPQPDYIFRAHHSDVNSICFFNKDKHFASADLDGTVVLWSMASRRPVFQWKAHQSSCLSVHVVGDDTLISQGRDNVINVWKFQLDDPSTTPTLNYTLEYVCLNYCKVAVGQWHNHTLLIFPARGITHMVDIFDLDTKKWVVVDMGDAASDERRLCMAVAMHVSKDALFVTAGYENGSVACYRVAQDYQWQSQWTTEMHTQPVLALAIHDNVVLSTAIDNKVTKYDIVDGHCIKQITNKKAGLACVTIRPDNKIFATGGYDAKIRVFSMKTMAPLAVLTYHQDSVYAVAYVHPELQENKKHWMLAGSKDGRISLWALY